ncbi:MAG: Flp pilus assembly protein CpaB [Gammaproteobacteria bacterium]
MSNQVLKIIAAMMLIGSLALIFIAYQMGKPPKPTTASIAPAAIKTYPIVKAANTIPAGHVIQENDLKLEESTTRPPGAFDTIPEVLGKRVIAGVERDSTILHSHFATGNSLAQTLKPNERAIAVKVDEFVGVGGFIQPGDFVDVIAYIRADSMQKIDEAQAVVALHAIRVLAYGEELPVSAKKSNEKSEEAAKGKTGKTTAILAMDVEQTPKLSLLDNAAILRLALRPADAAPNLEDKPYSVTVRDIIETEKKPKGNHFQSAKPLGPMVEIYHGTQVEQIQYP